MTKQAGRGIVGGFLGLFGLGRNANTPDPTDDFWYTRIGRKTASGERVDETTAYGYSAVWACTRILSATGGMLPLNLIRRQGKRQEIQHGHRLQRILHFAPNAEQGSMMFRSHGIAHQVNAGNFFAEIERRDNEVAALHPIHPLRVTPLRDQSDRLFYRVKNSAGLPTDFDAKDIFHVPSPMSEDGIVGKGVVTCARESIGFGLVTERQGAAYFRNSARPTVVIKGGKFSDAEARKDYRRQWMEIHSGADNNGLPALLPEGADVSFLSFSQEDSQFLQTRQHNTEEVARWYGVPPHMIGHLLRSTFNNIETQSIEFVTYSLISWLKLWEEEIWKKLLTDQEKDAGYFAKHNVNGLLRGDSKARAEFYKSLASIGVLSINDILELEDANPCNGGDVRFIPLNVAVLEPSGEIRVLGKEGADEAPSAAATLAHYTAAAPPAAEDGQSAEREANKVAAAWMEETFARMVHKQTGDVIRAAEKQVNFLAWMDSYLERFEEQLVEAISKPAKALGSSAKEIAAGHIAQCRADLLAATDGDADGFIERVRQVTSGWGDNSFFKGQQDAA